MRTRKEDGGSSRQEVAPNSHVSSRTHSSAETHVLRGFHGSHDYGTTEKSGSPPHSRPALRFATAVGRLVIVTASLALAAALVRHLLAGPPSVAHTVVASLLLAAVLAACLVAILWRWPR